jgi:hypothetical protein
LPVSRDIQEQVTEPLEEACLHSRPKAVDDGVDVGGLYVVDGGPGADGNIHLLEELEHLSSKHK